MVGLFLAGIIKILSGVLDLLRMRDSMAGLGGVLKGIELLFLAPLALLAFISMVLFVQQYYSSVTPAAGQRRAPAIEMVHGVKLALAFLVVAILLTDLVEKTLTGQRDTWLGLATESLGILLGLAYAATIHRLNKSH